MSCRVYIGSEDGNGYVDLGICTAMVITLPDGSKFKQGSVEEIFDLELTDDDKKFLNS